MKQICCFLVLFLIGFSAFSQSAEEAEVKKVVTNFFEAFHRQDTVALRKLSHSSITMQSIATDAEGNHKLSTNSYGNFLRSIAGIPSTTKFEEKLHSFDVEVNGALANVTTPYSFHLNNTLSHCGVNSFTMVKVDGKWKIVYLIDTRRKDNCNSMKSKAGGK